MKSIFSLKEGNRRGEWFLVTRFNNITLLRIALILAALALVWGLVELLLFIVPPVISGISWTFGKIGWFIGNFWWLLLALLALAGLIWAFVKGWFDNFIYWLKSLFKKKQKPSEPSDSTTEKKSKDWWWLLLLLIPILLFLFFWRGCDEKEDIPMPEPIVVVYENSFDDVIIARAYLDGVQGKVPEYCPRALVGFKFINDKSVKDYNFEGKTYEEAIQVVAEDWKPLVVNNLNPSVKLSNQQMAVVTLTAMRMGKNGFPRSTFLQKVNEGDFEGASNWLLLQKENGEVRKTGDEPKQYFYILRLLWEEKITIEELLDLPMFSYKGVSVDVMYDQNGSHNFSDNIWFSLKQGHFATPRVALELE